MPTICPHCRAVRPESAQASDWQCPSCGKAYVKAGGAMTPRTSQRAVPSSAVSAGTCIPWGRLLAGVAIVSGAWVGLHKAGGVGGNGGISHASRFAGNPSVEQLGQLAASRQASDVLMYSAAWCPNCTAAKGWMGQYGFKY